MRSEQRDKRVLVVLLFMLNIGTLSATTFYVTPSGAGLFNGSSWANAALGSSLQTTINSASTGDEIWVSAGTYYTTSGTNRAISFAMKDGVTIYGSFTGNETLLSQRMLSSGITSILSAEIGAAGIADNSYHTIHNVGLNTTAVLDGFVIKDANDNRVATANNGLGGGIYNDGDGLGNTCSPTIRNCVITNNQAVFGAGIFNNGSQSGTSSPIIINCVITLNNATTGGGGIDNFGLNGNASPTITNCIVYANTAAQRAGGMYCWGGDNGNANPVVLNTAFVNNSAVDGGAIVSDRLNSSSGSSGNSNPNFRNCIFWGNTASGVGPQFFILGGATFNATYSDVNLTAQSTPHVISGTVTGNINSDPLYSNISLGAGLDGKWMTSDDGMQLQNTSPCVDAGDDLGAFLTDIISNSRIVGAKVDMGPYENQTNVLSVNENTSNDNLKVFPNFSNGLFTIEINSIYEPIPYTISDIKGKFIENGKLTVRETTIDITKVETGIYFLKILDQTIRLIKQ